MTKQKKTKKEGDAEVKIVEPKDDLAAQLEAVTKEKEELFAKLQRVSADFMNFEKRAPKQIADSVAYEKKSIIKSLLGPLDNLEHALGSVEGDDKQVDENFVKGVQIVFDHMIDALKAHGVERVDAKDKPFDPSKHEALMRRSEPDKEDNVVLEEFQAGYMLGGQMIRPSKVIVNKVEAEQKQVPESVEPEVESDEQEGDK